MTAYEHICLILTTQLLISKQRIKFNLFRAGVINYLQKEIDNNLEEIKTKE